MRSRCNFKFQACIISYFIQFILVLDISYFVFFLLQDYFIRINSLNLYSYPKYHLKANILKMGGIEDVNDNLYINNNEKTVANGHHYIPASVLQRMSFGKISPNELEKYFPISKTEINEIQSSSINCLHGKVCCFLSLEDCLIDTRTLYSYAYSIFLQLTTNTNTISRDNLDRKWVYNNIGNIFSDIISGLGIDRSIISNLHELKIKENQFYKVFETVLNEIPLLEAFPGAMELLNSIIEDRMDVAIVTSLPRPLAIKIIEKSKVVHYLRGRVNPENLICLTENLEHQNQPSSIFDDNSSLRDQIHTPSSFQQHIMKMCCRFRKNTLNSVFISSNSQHILAIKRLGFNAFAVRGLAYHPHELRMANKVVSSISEITLKDIYKIVKNTIISSLGPATQTATVTQLSPLKLKSLSTSSLMKDGSSNNQRRGTRSYSNATSKDRKWIKRSPKPTEKSYDENTENIEDDEIDEIDD